MNTLTLCLRFTALLALQVLVMSHIHLMGYCTPMITCGLLLYFPHSASRVNMMLWSFALGLCVDIFHNTPGVCAGSMTFVAMCRPFLLELQMSRDDDEDFVPTYRSMGTWQHTRYIFLLVFTHLLAYHALESFSFFHLSDVVLSFCSSMLLSWGVLLLIDSLRKR